MDYFNFDFFTLSFYLSIGFLITLIFYFQMKYFKIDNIDNKSRQKSELLKKIITIFLFLYLICIASFRYINIGIGGIDSLGYINNFMTNNRLEIDLMRVISLRQQEPLFLTLTFLIRRLTDNYRIYFLIIYSIIVYGYLHFLSDNFDETMIFSPILLSIVNYIYSFSSIRSSIALFIGILAINNYRKSNKTRGVFIAIIAALFHYSSFIIIVFFIFYEIHERDLFKGKIVILLSIIISTILVYLTIDVGSNYFVTTKYRTYLETQNNLKGQIPTIVLALITFINHKSLIEKMKEKKIYIYSVYFNVIIIPIIMYMGAYRLGSYFDFPKIVVISYLISIIMNKYSSNNKWGKSLIYLSIYILIFIWTAYKIIRISSSAGLMPYSNIIFR